MKTSIYLFVLSLLIGFSSSVFGAQTLYYNSDADRTQTGRDLFPDKESVCTQILAKSRTFYGGTWWDSATIVVSGDYCVLSGQYPTQYQIATVDSTCVEPEVWDSSTQSCKSVCKSGDSSFAGYYVPGYWSVGPGINDVVQPSNYTRPTSLCDGRCKGTVSGSADCASTGGVHGGTVSAPVPVQCNFQITLDGTQCSGDNGKAPLPCRSFISRN